MAYAEASDIEARLGRTLDSSEAQIVDARLEDAELLLMSRIPDLADQIADGKIKEALVVMIEADAVLRLIKNLEGYTEETDGNYSYRINQDVASGRLEILPEDWGLLGIRRRIFTITPRIGYGCGIPELYPLRHFEPGPYWRHRCSSEYPCNCGAHNPDHPAVWWGNESS